MGNKTPVTGPAYRPLVAFLHDGLGEPANECGDPPETLEVYHSFPVTKHMQCLEEEVFYFYEE